MRRRTTIAAACALGVAIAVAGCGVPIDDEPRVIDRAAAPPSTETPTTIAGNGSPEVSVYFLRDGRLERQAYPSTDGASLAEAIRFVLEPPAEGSDAGLSTAVPPATVLRGVEVTQGVATIDLSSQMDDISSTAQKEAFAQIVFTALDFPEVTEVRFLIDGELIDAPTDDGNLALISEANYDEPLNPR